MNTVRSTSARILFFSVFILLCGCTPYLSEAASTVAEKKVTKTRIPDFQGDPVADQVFELRSEKNNKDSIKRQLQNASITKLRESFERVQNATSVLRQNLSTTHPLITNSQEEPPSLQKKDVEQMYMHTMISLKETESKINIAYATNSEKSITEAARSLRNSVIFLNKARNGMQTFLKEHEINKTGASF